MTAPARLRVGVDVCDVVRITHLVTAHPRLAQRLFTAAELDCCGRTGHSGPHLAARFAAKEAVLKAFGTGMSAGMRWIDVEVVAGAGGRPRIRLHGLAESWAATHGLLDLDVSIAHDASFALAYVIIVWAVA